MTKALSLYMPLTIISGGQTGADLGGLLAAEACGIHTSGWAPKYFKTEKGNQPLLGQRFNLIEHDRSGYPPRTSDNVRDSHVTLIFSTNPNSSGTVATQKLCVEHDRADMLISDLSDPEKIFREVWAFLSLHRPKVINVAGNRESVSRGLTVQVRNILTRVFKQYLADLTGHIIPEEQQGTLPSLYPALSEKPEPAPEAPIEDTIR